MRLYNTKSRTIQDFVPLHPPFVGMYTCGPTVYDYQHIGHMRRYVGDDVLVRILKLSGFDVKQVMNITDVGHLVSDSDSGEDKMEKGSKKFGKSVWDIAKMFEEQFMSSAKQLNIDRPGIIMRATDYITDQIEFIQVLEEKGYTYKIEDGIYFDTSKFENYHALSGQKKEELKAGARVEMIAGKKNPTDFALWKFSPKNTKRQMEWESPWGVGFPGWHIECSAMSVKALGPSFDIHTGGIDHIAIHHTNEIAQSEAASGKTFVNYWVHHNFLLVNGQKMSKSLENTYTVSDVTQKGFSALSLRYLYFQTHYRQEMNFTWESLEAAQKTLHNLYTHISYYPEIPGEVNAGFFERYKEALNDDMNMPQALGVMWELVKSDVSDADKKATLLAFDEILGLNFHLVQKQEKRIVIPKNIQELIEEREALRKQKRFHLADSIRHKINKLGYDVLDTKKGPQIKIITE